jgi:YVTN family beta-propeller protein
MTNATITGERTTAASDVSFWLLGPLVVTRSGDELVLGGRQQRAVLAQLLIEVGHTVSLARLADQLWAETVPHGAATTIQTYVSHLRDVLEPGRSRGERPSVLVTGAGGYRLDVDESRIDGAVFQRRIQQGVALLAAGENAAAADELRAALSLWRSDALSDLLDYPFVAAESTRLGELRLVGLEALADADLRRGRASDVIGLNQPLVAAHPLRERLHEQLMLALYRCGRQAEALEVHDRLVATLAGELGIDPSPAVQSLHQAILRQDARLDPPPPATNPTPATDPTPPAAAADTPLPTPPASATQAPSVARAPPEQVAQTGRPTRSRIRWPATVLVLLCMAALLTASRGLSRGSLGRPGLRGLKPNSVARLVADGALRTAVPVGQGPSAVAVSGGAVWITNEGSDSVSRVDEHDGRVVQTVATGAQPNAVTVSAGSAWVTNAADGTVSRISTSTNEVVDTIHVGNLPSAIASGGGGVWVANGGDDTVERIDPQSDTVGRPISVGGRPSGLAVVAGTVWVTNGQDDTLSRVDAASGESESPVPVGAAPRGVTVSDGAVWVANSTDLTVSRLDASTGRVVDTIPVGDGPHSIAVTGHRVWVGNEYDGTVSTIDSRTDRVVKRIRLDSSPRGLAATGSAVWVAAQDSVGARHRGGTLTVVADPVPGFDGVDPAATWIPEVFSIPYDGLVSFRRTSGPEGFTLVPDLATTLPRPTDGGRTYTFTVRRGIRYSNGVELRARDLRRGLVRALALHTAYFYGILGARRCALHPHRCDLSSGVRVDDTAFRITFHLRRPDPDFLSKLSSHVFAIPPGVRPGAVHRPVPATGPYMISGYNERGRLKRITLVRNRYFRQWSFAAKPDGYPDVIRWRKVIGSRKRIHDVVAGRADLVSLLADFSPRQITSLARNHASLVHSTDSPGTYFAWLNTHKAPFNHVQARRALNFAVDRRAMVRVAGGAMTGELSCQILPRNYPSYVRYCPYTSRPSSSGGYQGPDLPAARRLVAASGTEGVHITLWSDAISPFLALDRYVASVLRSIGYPTRLRVDTSRERRVTDQLGMSWWSPDFPSPSNFWEPLLSCSSDPRSDPAGYNEGGFCDPAIDRTARRALRAQTVDPALARRRWSEVDHALTDEAPWVPGPVTRYFTVTSPRLGNFQTSPVYGQLPDRMWVR